VQTLLNNTQQANEINTLINQNKEISEELINVENNLKSSSQELNELNKLLFRTDVHFTEKIEIFENENENLKNNLLISENLNIEIVQKMKNMDVINENLVTEKNENILHVLDLNNIIERMR
jgi:hypothetical protein